MNLKKLYYGLLFCLSGKRKYKKIFKEKWGTNNKLIIIDENGNKKEFPPEYDTKLKWLDIHWMGSNNTVTIEMPTRHLQNLQINIKSDNNTVCIGKYLQGRHTFNLLNGDNHVKLGERVSAMAITVTLNSGSLTIGNNCMISGFIDVLTDGHSVIDKDTKELLNKERADIKIGNHVWIGYSATLLKNAKIPDNSIVANSSVVTKAFEEENIVMAGNPARVVKRGINWNQAAPVEYSKETADFSF